jgi:hypothetical protein
MAEHPHLDPNSDRPGHARIRLWMLLLLVALCALGLTIYDRGPGWWERYQNHHRRQATIATLRRPVTITISPPSTFGEGLQAIQKATICDQSPWGLPLSVNPAGLAQVGCALSTEVLLTAWDLPAGETLQELLDPMGLVYHVDETGLVRIDARVPVTMPLLRR